MNERCCRKSCQNIGLISLSELCNRPYYGPDETLLFCEDHVLEMLFRYQLFKDIECDIAHLIKRPYLIPWFYLRNANYLTLHTILQLLQHTLQYRRHFQSLIVTKHSPVGHKHWMENIMEAIALCEQLTWTIVSRKRKRRKQVVESWYI